MMRASSSVLLLATFASLALAPACASRKRTGVDFDTPAGVGGGGGGGGVGGGSTTGGSGDGGGGALPDGAVASCIEPTFVDGFTPRRKLYVSPAGVDTADGLTPGSAWRTLANIGRAQAGDSIEIAKGTYPCGVTVTAQGTAALPVVIRSTDGPRKASFECGADEYGFQLLGAKYVAIDGLVISGAREDNVRVANAPAAPAIFADHILVKNSFITSAGGADVRVLGASSFDLLSNEIAASEALGPRADGQGVELVAVRGARLLLNRIHDIPDDIAVYAHGGADTLLFDGNKVNDVREAFRIGGTSTPAQFLTDPTAEYEARNVVAVNNAVWGAVSIGLSFYGCTACLTSNNSFALRGAQAAIRAAQGNAGPSAPGRESHTASLQVLNSIFAFDPPQPSRIFDFTATETSGFVNANNIFFANGARVLAISSQPGTQGEGVLVDVDPAFVDVATGNLRPGATSPAFGRASFVAQVTRDATGACRTERDIGAY